LQNTIQAWATASNITDAPTIQAKMAAQVQSWSLDGSISVTNYQTRKTLGAIPSPINTGKTLFDDVDAYCKAQGGDVGMAWEYANVFVRNDPMIKGLGVALNLSADQLDALFAQGSG